MQLFPYTKLSFFHSSSLYLALTFCLSLFASPQIVSQDLYPMTSLIYRRELLYFVYKHLSFLFFTLIKQQLPVSKNVCCSSQVKLRCWLQICSIKQYYSHSVKLKSICLTSTAEEKRCENHQQSML